MAYFTLKLRTQGGEVCFETDFTTHELIPLVRQVMRSLGAHRELRSDLISYRAIVTPRYDGTPSTKTYTTSDLKPTPGPPAVSTSEELLHISEEDLEIYAPVSYSEELEAYYNPGTSPLCIDCPERHRCPGSGRQTETGISDWILIDPTAPRTNEPIRYFTLRIESHAGKLIYQTDFPLDFFRIFIKLTVRLLEDKGRLALPEQGLRGEVIARYEGQPRIDPILSPKTRPPIRMHLEPLSPSPVAAPAPPRRLVDWDRLEKEESQPDVDIKVLPSEPEPLARRPTPDPECTAAVGTIAESELLIFLNRSAVKALEEARQGLRHEIGGVLVGEAYRRPSDDRPWVEVVGILPAADGQGETGSMTFDFNRLRESLNREFPGQRPVGWYRFHLLGGQPRLAVYDGQHLLAHLYTSDTNERLSLLQDESFMHRNFFPQPWHVGLVIDGIEGHSRFYHLRGEEIVGCNGYMLVS